MRSIGGTRYPQLYRDWARPVDGKRGADVKTRHIQERSAPTLNPKRTDKVLNGESKHEASEHALELMDAVRPLWR